MIGRIFLLYMMYKVVVNHKMALLQYIKPPIMLYRLSIGL